MFNAPYLLPRSTAGKGLGDVKLFDSLLIDGLTDPFGHGHMGATAERLAERFNILRRAQDEHAAGSQQRYARAASEERFAAEMVAVDGLDRNEHPRPEATADSLAKVKPVFKPDGTVTAGNASGLNDGAAALVVCDEPFARQRSLPVLAFISGGAAVGCDPAATCLGPVDATRVLCGKLGLSSAAFDHIELNEAFPAQVSACLRELRLDDGCVNPNGGAIAVGHPIGASGARLAAHLAHQLAAGRARRGLATLCVGGGMGCAISLEAAP